MTDAKPFVTVIVPCRNEASFISRCLDTIVANDYPKDRMEVLVVDGLSEDGTRSIVLDYALRYPFIRMLDNPERITPTALNAGIRQSQGDSILWMSAHNAYQVDYISRSVEAQARYDADNVGGIIRARPRRETFLGYAIVEALGSRFGVGNSHFRTHPKDVHPADTVFGGCYRRGVFERVGLFNENLVRGQDMEFNLRLRRAGGKILVVPGIVSEYFARSEPWGFLEHTFINGVWAILPFRHSSIIPVSWRHLVPGLFVSSLLASSLAAWWHPIGVWMLGAVAGSYALLNLAASWRVVFRRRDLRHLAVMPLVFAGLHLAYGFGSLWGILLLLSGRGKPMSGRRPHE